MVVAFSTEGESYSQSFTACCVQRYINTKIAKKTYSNIKILNINPREPLFFFIIN